MSSLSAPPPSSKSPPELKLDPFFFVDFAATTGDLTGSSTGLTGSVGLSDSLDLPNRSTPPGKRATPPTGFFDLRNTQNYCMSVV